MELITLKKEKLNTFLIRFLKFRIAHWKFIAHPLKSLYKPKWDAGNFAREGSEWRSSKIRRQWDAHVLLAQDSGGGGGGQGGYFSHCGNFQLVLARSGTLVCFCCFCLAKA